MLLIHDLAADAYQELLPSKRLFILTQNGTDLICFIIMLSGINLKQKKLVPISYREPTKT